MYTDFIKFIILLSPLAFIATALASWFQPGLRPILVKRLAVSSTLISIVSAAFSGFFVAQYGLMEVSVISFFELGISLRLDALSILMFSMIAIIGFVVVKFSLNYIDGDNRQGRFIGRLAATIAAVQLLVLSGNLFLLLASWILTSVCLHRLLVFYYDRPGSLIAARKKFIVARLGDGFLFGAFALFYFQFGTGNLELIFQEINGGLNNYTSTIYLEVAALFMVLAAMLKSAQFPTHGWLIEVMETPTPVSALLHAGLLNAGPFLLIRFAYVMEASSFAPILIISVGGITALFASIAFLTQTSIKTALGYSSVAHMGFSLMVCGLGVYPAAMLHLVAHSFYKAHAFLSSGSVIDLMRANKVKKVKRTGNPLKISLGIALALGIYLVFAAMWGLNVTEDLPLVVIGAFIVMGLSTIFTSALDSNGSVKLVLRASFLALVVTSAFFILESGTHSLLASQLPEAMNLSLSEMIVTGTLLFFFGSVVFIQILAPSLPSKPLYRAIALHFRNGLYANAIFDRMIGALHIHSPKNTSVPFDTVEKVERYKPIKMTRFKEQVA